MRIVLMLAALCFTLMLCAGCSGERWERFRAAQAYGQSRMGDSVADAWAHTFGAPTVTTQCRTVSHGNTIKTVCSTY